MKSKPSPKYPPERIQALESHSKMLGEIASFVQDFCPEPDSTTLEGVLALLEAYHTAHARIAELEENAHTRNALEIQTHRAKLKSLRTFTLPK